MKIALASLDYNGYDAFIVKELKKRGIQVYHIDLMVLKIAYPNFFFRILNFITKLFGWNFKNKFQKTAIEKELKKAGEQDKLLVIRADLFTDDSLRLMKEYSKEFIAYHYDCVNKFPRAIQVSNYFDKVYSFEKKDCQHYGYNFITNYIYDDIKVSNIYFKYKFFNVSSHDERTPIIEEIAKELNKQTYSFYIRIVGKFGSTYKKIENILYTKKYIPLEEVKKIQEESMVLLDVGREGQEGLSFRFFEALAQSKKIITTNISVKEYDFYKSENIVIIDKNNIEVESSFFESQYSPIEGSILDKYTISNWVEEVFGVKK